MVFTEYTNKFAVHLKRFFVKKIGSIGYQFFYTITYKTCFSKQTLLLVLERCSNLRITRSCVQTLANHEGGLAENPGFR